MSDEMLTDIRMYSRSSPNSPSFLVRILQDDMINRDSVSKQESRLQTMAEEVKSTDEELQDVQVLNLQLSSEHNTLMTNLSHILNERNRILLECEGLKDSVSLLLCQVNDMAEAVQKEQDRRNNLKTELATLRDQWQACEQTCESIHRELKACMSTTSKESFLQVERDELHASNQQLRDQIALEEEKRTVGEQTLSNVQTSLQQLEKSRKQQQRQLAQMQNRNMLANQDLTVTHNNLLTTKRNIDERRAAIANLRTEYEQGIAAFQLEKDHHAEEKQKLEMELSTEQEQFTELQKQTAVVEEEKRQAECTLDILTKQREEVEAAIQDLTTSIHSCESSCSSLQTSLDDLTVQKSDLQQELTSLEERLHQAHISRSQQITIRDQLVQTLQAVRNQVTQATEQQTSLQQEHAELVEKQSLLETIQSLQTEILTLQESITKRKAERDARKQAESSLEALQKNISSLEQQLLEERRRRVEKRTEALALKRKEYARREAQLLEDRRKAEAEGERRLQIAQSRL